MQRSVADAKRPRMHLISTHDTSANPPLPTPGPTSASVISEEDAAIQLMRLIDPLAITPILSPVTGDDLTERVSEIESSHEINGDGGHTRCTLCIVSKKGCDKKRPCGRCVQLGIDPQDCVSDDERGSAKRKVAARRRSSMFTRTVGRTRRINRS